MKTYTAGELIRQFREAEGLTQNELADIIHVSQLKLAHWEENSTIPNPTMVARLTGALRLSKSNADRLAEVVKAARTVRAQEKALEQAVINEQNEEIDRLRHKKKALLLLCSGFVGFVGCCVFLLVTGSYKDYAWYFPILIGVAVSGIPYGWSLLTGKSNIYHEAPYTPYREMQRDSLLITLAFTVLKFICAYLIGVLSFPISLFYHAYKAGRKGSLYRTIMFVAFIAVLLLVGTVLAILLSSVVP